MNNSQLKLEHYNKKTFWQKVRGAAKKAGKEVIYNSLLLFHTARADGTPVWCKTVILGTLGYFISVIDGIPDVTPVLGYSDDLSLMLAALGTLTQYVTPEIKSKAEKQANKIFEVDTNSTSKNCS